VPGTRDRLVAATTELFRRHGLNGTSLKDVTTAAGAPIGSLYHFFPGGKTALARAVLVETGAAYQQLFELIAAEADGPAAAIGDFFDGAADMLAASDFVDVCPIGSVAHEVAFGNEVLREATAAVFLSWNAAAAAHFTAAGLGEVEAADLATTVIAALEGGFVLARSQRDAEVLRRIGRQARRLVEVAVELASGGAGPAAAASVGRSS
jgi:AcrR family transcriptional regulator